MRNPSALLGCLLLLSFVPPDFSARYQLPAGTDRSNIFQLANHELEQIVQLGKTRALIYPVQVTGLLIPFRPTQQFFELNEDSALRRRLYRVAQDMSGFASWQDLFSYIGLNSYPKDMWENYSQIPIYEIADQFPMGSTLMRRDEVLGLTFSCAACHSAELFGRKILGMTNRFPRSNDLFVNAKQASQFIPAHLYQSLLNTTDKERDLYQQNRQNFRFIGARKPQVLGLDTSLAQVGISLSLRQADEYASKRRRLFRFPHPLEKIAADSKPAVWWNLKYKTRWLSDGSIVQGNPVHTNLLWNELGRGADLKKLESWLDRNQHLINELTAAVFASEAPRFEDFFSLDNFSISKAQKGEKIYQQNCAECHGQYHKAWNQNNAAELNARQLIQTTKVIYHQKTPVKDVGTDPLRYQGMKYFADDLNRLKISKKMKTIVRPQKGYVPPPLVGIWARWPYFHNNSIPNLCALLTPAPQRPKGFWMGEAIDPSRHFDRQCNGYPIEEQTPTEWKQDPLYYFDTQIEGLSNMGHDKILLDEQGNEVFTPEDKENLILFLQTL